MQKVVLSPIRGQGRDTALLSALSLGLLLGSLGLAAPAAEAADLASLTFQHAPNSPGVEGWVNVSLDNAGNWSQVDTAVVPWRFSMEALWNEPPQVTYVISINIRPASLPAPPSASCEGDNCGAAFGNLGGYTAQSVVPELTSSGPKFATVIPPLGEIDIAPGIYQDVTGVCHTMRQNLLNGGTPLHDLLAEGFVTDGTEMVATLLFAFTAGMVQVDTPIPFKVRCKGDPQIADAVAPETNYQGAYSSGYQLSKAAFNIVPGTLTGSCPLQLTGQAIVEGNGPGAFRYRLEFANGTASHWSESSLVAAGGSYSRVLQLPIPIPLPAAPGGGSGGSGGVVMTQPGGGLAIQQQPEEPVFPGQDGGPATPGAVSGTKDPDNVHKGAARLAVSKPDGSNQVVSAFDGYNVTCQPQVALGGPKALQMQPKPPQPGTAAIQPGGLAATGKPGTPRRQAPVPTLPRAGLSSGLKADIMATTLGFVLAGGPNPWGSTVVIDKPQLAAATGVGPRRNLCRFTQAGYRPFNKGDVQSGPFKNKVYRGSATVDQSVHNLAPKQTDGWRTFALELPSGLSVIRVVMDADRQVDESNEDNTFAIRVDVKLDCGGAPKRTTPQRDPQPQRLAPQRQ